MASDASASNVALSSASGATSRFIGYAAGGLFIVLGFPPKISGLLSMMSGPVMGAILVFVTSFMILSGVQIILGSEIDARKIFVVGVAIIFGLSLDMVPSLYAGIFAWLRPLFDSSLTLATAIAVRLNQLLRGRAAPKSPAPAEWPHGLGRARSDYGEVPARPRGWACGTAWALLHHERHCRTR